MSIQHKFLKAAKKRLFLWVKCRLETFYHVRNHRLTQMCNK